MDSPVLFWALLLLPAASATLRGLVQLDHHFWLSWRPGQDDVEFTAVAKARGYLGIALATREPGRPTADVVMAWVDDTTGKGHLVDCHISKGKIIPMEDSIQNYKLVESTQNETHTTIKFSRAWDTCDRKHDVAIVNDTMRIMWTMSDDDPGIFSSWAGLVWHGNKGIHIGSPSRIPTGRHDKFWDVTAQDFLLNGDSHTIYWCKIYKVPLLEKKQHIIGYKPLIQRGHEALLQRMVLYECLGSSEFEQYGSHEGAECHSASVPKDWEACVTPVVAWSTGSQGEFYPETFGLPMAEGEGKSTYFMLEIHYDNPSYSNVRDNSGLRIFFTDELRPHDGGMFITGIAVAPTQLIPPLQRSFISNGYCDNQCTNLMFPESGIHVASVVFHSHAAGRQMRLRHVREGKELPIIAQDKQYDPTYQQARRIPDNTVIMPGDDIITECQYNTSNRTKLTVGGFTTRQETCTSYILYYPRMALAGCTSMTPVDFFFQTFGVKEFYNHNLEEIEDSLLKHSNKPSHKSSSKQPMQKLFFRFSEKEGFNMDLNKHSVSILKAMAELNKEDDDENIFSNLIIHKPDEFQNKSFMEHLRDLPWAEKIFTQSVEQILHNGKYRTFCRLQNNSPAMPSQVYNFPNISSRVMEIQKENPSICQYQYYDTDSANEHAKVHSVNIIITCFLVLKVLMGVS